MNKNRKIGALFPRALLSLSLSALSPGLAAQQSSPDLMDPAVLSEIMALHGLDEAAVIERLAREEVAAAQFAAIRALELDNYAGAWFDADTQQLHVAVADESDFATVEAVGAIPVLVERSLWELEQLALDIRADLATVPDLGAAILSRSINYRENNIEINARPADADALRARLRRDQRPETLVRVFASTSVPAISGDIRGADGTRNGTWTQTYGGTWPCSVGAAIVGGYVTAGHCGYAGNVMHTPSGQLLGTVQASQWTNGGDGGWVQSASGWAPRPKINGYSDGIIDVAAEWSGLQISPVGSTICRYGQTSGGPDCGAVEAFDETVEFFGGSYDYLGNPIYVTVYGMTRASGICTDDGDSGGTYVTATGQVQGTNTGGQPTNTCPTPAEKVWFQPIGDTLSSYSKTMLTVHGATKATANGFACPDFANSGSGIFYCKIDSYNSQGATTLNWTSNASVSSTRTFLTGSCASGSWVTVDLALSNPYGVRNISSGFTCPTNTIP